MCCTEFKTTEKTYNYYVDCPRYTFSTIGNMTNDKNSPCVLEHESAELPFYF